MCYLSRYINSILHEYQNFALNILQQMATIIPHTWRFFFISGGSALGGVFEEIDEQESINVVHAALNGGINYIDTAPWYGQGKSETLLGKV